MIHFVVIPEIARVLQSGTRLFFAVNNCAKNSACMQLTTRMKYARILALINLSFSLCILFNVLPINSQFKFF